jgi:hypothetical protein
MRDLGDDAIRGFLDRGAPAPSIPPCPSDGSAGIGTSTNRFSLPAGAPWVRRRRAAHVERGGIGDPRVAAEHVAEVLLPVAGEQQRVVGQLRQFALDAEQQQEGAGPGLRRRHHRCG